MSASAAPNPRPRVFDSPAAPESDSEPHNHDAERAVLGAMILDAEAVEKAAMLLTAECFHMRRHFRIFEAILVLSNTPDCTVDFMTVMEHLRRAQTLEDCGGAVYILSLESHVFSTANVEHHAKIVREKHQLRELARLALTVRNEALTEQDDVGALLTLAQERLFQLGEARAVRDFRDIGELTVETMVEIDLRASSTHEVTGVATGFTDLDEWTGGFQKSDLIIIAARPSIGKTAFALNIASAVGAGLRGKQIMREQARPVAIFSLEMSASQVNMRMLSTIADVPMHAMRTGKLRADDRRKLHKASRELHGLPVYIDDTPSLGIMELRSKVRRLKTMRPDLALVMIDYLQLMRGGARTENRQQEISEITRGLKAIGRELEVPVVALSQLSRLIEQRKGKGAKPILSDLRESGSIEQDADVVMFLHREKHFDKKDGDEDGDAGNTIRAEKAELIIGKQRNGPIGTIDLVFFRETATYHNMAGGGGSLDGDDGPGF